MTFCQGPNNGGPSLAKFHEGPDSTDSSLGRQQIACRVVGQKSNFSDDLSLRTASVVSGEKCRKDRRRSCEGSRIDACPCDTFHRSRLMPSSVTQFVTEIRLLPDKQSAVDPSLTSVLNQVADVAAPCTVKLFNRLLLIGGLGSTTGSASD